MYPEFVTLLKLVAKENHVGAAVVSCGLREVLKRERVSKKRSVFSAEDALRTALLLQRQSKLAEPLPGVCLPGICLSTRCMSVYQVYV